jgi:hypothetical protein
MRTSLLVEALCTRIGSVGLRVIVMMITTVVDVLIHHHHHHHHHYHHLDPYAHHHTALGRTDLLLDHGEGAGRRLHLPAGELDASQSRSTPPEKLI